MSVDALEAENQQLKMAVFHSHSNGSVSRIQHDSEVMTIGKFGRSDVVETSPVYVVLSADRNQTAHHCEPDYARMTSVFIL